MKTYLSLRVSLAALFLVAGSACSEAPTVTAPVAAAAAKPALTLAQQIDTEIGTAACDNAKQCRSLPVGHKACGGPEGYRAYSTKTSNADKLVKLATQQAEEQKAADAASGRMSNCSMAMDPGATCNAGTCVLQKAGNSAQ